jgi:hypothetical protein
MDRAGLAESKAVASVSQEGKAIGIPAISALLAEYGSTAV